MNELIKWVRSMHTRTEVDIVGLVDGATALARGVVNEIQAESGDGRCFNVRINTGPVVFVRLPS